MRVFHWNMTPPSHVAHKSTPEMACGFRLRRGRGLQGAYMGCDKFADHSFVQPDGRLHCTSWVCKLRTMKCFPVCRPRIDRKSTRLNSSHQIISYAVFCLKKKKKTDFSWKIGRLQGLTGKNAI